MDETQTQIAWPSKLKIGAKSKKGDFFFLFLFFRRKNRWAVWLLLTRLNRWKRVGERGQVKWISRLPALMNKPDVVMAKEWILSLSKLYDLFSDTHVSQAKIMCDKGQSRRSTKYSRNMVFICHASYKVQLILRSSCKAVYLCGDIFQKISV